MAWTVNFKACKRCSSGEYWLVSSRFTNTVHPVAAGSPLVALQTLPDVLEPWEGGEGSQNTGGTSSRPWQSSPGWGLLPVPGSPPREGLVAELSSQPRWGWWHWAPGAVPSIPRVTQVGLDCEGNSAMSSQRRVQRGQPAPLAVFLRCCSPGVTGRGPGRIWAFSPITHPPTLPFWPEKVQNHPKRRPHPRASQ